MASRGKRPLLMGDRELEGAQPAGDVVFLQGSCGLQTKKGTFKLLCILEKRKELCSVQVNTYVVQMLAGGLPVPKNHEKSAQTSPSSMAHGNHNRLPRSLLLPKGP